MPNIPFVRSRDSVQGALGGLDRSYSNVRATPDMFGAQEAKALASAGDAIGGGLTSLAGAYKEYEQKDRAEKVIAADAMNPLTPTALDAQQAAPADGTGLLLDTKNKMEEKINADAARLFPNDPKAAQQYRVRKLSEAGGLIRNAATMEYGMRLTHSRDLTNDALSSLDNQLRVNPGGYDGFVSKATDMIDASLTLNATEKENYKRLVQPMFANSRFEGMLLQAKTVDDLNAIERELTVPGDDGKNKWQDLLRPAKPGQESPYEKLLNRIHTAKTTFASKAVTEANAALDRYEKMGADRVVVPNAELLELKKQVDASQNGVVNLRYSRFIRDQDILTASQGMTPAQIQTSANKSRGGAGQSYPGVPAEVSGYINEATTAFPGVSGAYLGATAVREYGANFPRPKANAKFAPQPGRPDVDVANVSPVVQQNLTTAGELFGQPLVISSGYRSQAKQDAIRMSGDPNRPTVAKHSHHTEGNAVDISIVGMDGATRAKLVDSLVQSGFTGIGEYETHIHADMRENVPSSYRTGYGGWTNLSPEVAAVLDKRGFAPGKGASFLDRSGPVDDLRKRGADHLAPVDYTKGTSITTSNGVPTSSAKGLYQFVEKTWVSTLADPSVRAAFKAQGYDLDKMTGDQLMALRGDPRASTFAAAALATKNKSVLEDALHRDVNDAELYMAHLMGAGGATTFLRAYSMDRSTSAAALMPEAANANKPIFFDKEGRPRSVEQVYNLISGRFNADPTMVAHGDYQYKQKLATAKANGLKTNPIAEATNDRVIVQTPLTNEPSSWAARGESVRKIAGYYQLPNEDAKPFETNTEVQSLKKQITDGTSEQVVNLLKNMSEMDRVAPGSMAAGLDQLGQKNSAYGVAGDLTQRGDNDTAIAVVQGTKMLQDEKGPAQALLKDEGGQSAMQVWNATTRKALQSLTPEARDGLYKAANAHYVAAQSQNTERFNADLYKKSINAVLGGGQQARLGNVNGADTVLPSGVDAASMNNAVDNLNAEDLIKFSVDGKGKPNAMPPRYANGDIVSPNDVWHYGQFQYAGNDTYQINMDGRGLLMATPRDRYLIRMDAKAVKDINTRPRQRVDNGLGDPYAGMGFGMGLP